MINFNPSDKLDSDLNEIILNLGSFYNRFSDEDKTTLKKYYNALLTGLESLYFNLDEASNSYDLGSDTSFIDLSYNDFTIDFTTAERIKLEPVSGIVADYTIPEIAESYEYIITAVDAYGVQTPGSRVIWVSNGPAELSALTPITLSWSPVVGATSYNIYRGTNLVGNVSEAEFIDTGGIGVYNPIPKINNTFYKFIVPIPLEGYDIFNISVLKNVNSGLELLEGVDYFLEGTTKLSFTDKTAYEGLLLKVMTKYTYAFVPILANLYTKALLEDNNKTIFYNKEYQHYIDISSMTGYSNIEKNSRAWAFHLNKLFHNMSLVSRKSTTIINLGKMLSLVYNAPFAYSAGIVENLVTSDGYHTFTIGSESYKIPSKLNLNYTNGDVVDKYSILVEAVFAEDMFSTNTSLSASNIFSENKLLKFRVPEDLLTLGSSATLYLAFINKIIPKHLKTSIEIY